MDISFQPQTISIPYRYKQNLCFRRCGGLFRLVSIPYRYKQNFPIPVKSYQPQLLFQSPIGTNKTLQIKLQIRFIIKVSIPYRYIQNSLETIDIKDQKKFQSPIGTNKTKEAEAVHYI